MTEPDVALTDYFLSVLCAVFSFILVCDRASNRALKFSSLLFFCSIGIASSLGGTLHGFFLDQHGFASALLWRLTTLSIGVTSLACVLTATNIAFSRSRRPVIYMSLVIFCFYGIYVLADTRPFIVAILCYLPAILFLLCALVISRWQLSNRGAENGIAGIFITLLASALQQLKVGFHPVFFNHNALYHVLEAAALFLIFICFKRLLKEGVSDSTK
jgi:hypothetical protein